MPEGVKKVKPMMIEYISEIFIETCYHCGVPFGIHRPQREQLLENGKSFYCPAGHSQRYTKKERLEKQLEEKERLLLDAMEDAYWWQGEAEAQARKVAAAKGNMTKLRKRIANGVCPCCHRQFVNLQRHMTTQHPDYADENRNP
jgi:hypothetical protein